jgi:hypothetical protein
MSFGDLSGRGASVVAEIEEEAIKSYQVGVQLISFGSDAWLTFASSGLDSVRPKDSIDD